MNPIWINFYFIFKICMLICSIYSTATLLINKDQLLDFDLPPKGFGKYYVTVRYVEKCTTLPVDEKNLNIYELNIKKHNETFEEFTGYVYLPNKYKATGAKFTPMIQRNGVLKPTFNLTSENPCHDIVMSIPLSLIFNTDRSCIFEKGNYTIKSIDANKLIHLVFGENFMYERVHCMVEYLSKAGSTFCIYVVIDIRPIPKFRRKPKKKN